jgi:hypothetical protein
MSATTTHARRPAPTDAIERQILRRVDRAVRISERELRYQLDRKDNHPLAQADELLDVLAELDDLGLVESELCFRLTAEGRELLARAELIDRCTASSVGRAES